MAKPKSSHDRHSNQRTISVTPATHAKLKAHADILGKSITHVTERIINHALTGAGDAK